ncbi:MAG: TraB/GumN family protein [Alphaproteobacteria bacterium]
MTYDARLLIGWGETGLLSRRGLMLGATAAMTLAGLQSSPAQALSMGAPAVWRAHEGFTEVFLFGQMPIPAGTDWLSTPIKAALDKSKVFWSENPDAGDPKEFQRLSAEYGTEAGYNILNDLSARDQERLKAAYASVNAPIAMIEGQKPWLVRLVLGTIADQTGIRGRPLIPELELKNAAKQHGLPCRSEWRDGAQVIAFSSGLPKSIAIDLVRMALDDIDTSKNYQDVLNSWLSGDLAVQTQMDEAWRARYPQAYEAILTKRNAAWVPRIRAMFDEGTNGFVCVGVGHLVGPYGIPAQLRAAGIETVLA